MGEHEVLARLPLVSINRVTFYKRDELTTDLICCDVDLDGSIRSLHEEMPCWADLIAHLEGLPGFRAGWFGAVSQPPFGLCETVAFSR